jgi:hypothetical protein
VICGLAFPDNQDCPALPFKFRADDIVPSNVAGKFREPVFLSRSGGFSAQRACMLVPEAAMDQYHFAQDGEYKIRSARKVRAMQAEAIPHPVGAASDDQFRAGVALPDFGHPRANRGRHVGKPGRPPRRDDGAIHWGSAAVSQ